MRGFVRLRCSAIVLSCCAMLAACEPSADEALPEVRSAPEARAAACTLPAGPPPIQVAGNGELVAACMPRELRQYTVEVGLTLAPSGVVTSVHVPASLSPPVAACIRRRASTFEFLVIDPCHLGAAEIELSFGREEGVPGASERHNNALNLTSGAG